MEGECSTSAGGPSGPAVQFAKQDGLDRQEAEHRERLAGEKQKLGHRRIDELGEVSYKKVPTNALMSAIQLGIANSIGSLASYPQRDLLVQDFDVIETVAFPTIGSQTTPSHPYGDFRFKTYAPIAFRYFRELFHIKPADFLRSICTDPLKELSNAGASGSIFYVSHDDNFIIKTVQHKEAEFLQKLLPGYYMNINQNPRTLLPKFFGLFCYQSLGKNIRLLVMNNLLPQAITMHEKYDLKGSTYKRLASKAERAKAHPTLKDLDFVENHKNGLDLEPSVYEALLSTLQRDALVLEAFKIMDYSLLVGIHNVDIQEGTQGNQLRSDSEDQDDGDMPSTSRTGNEHKALKSKFSVWEGMKGSTSNSDAVTAFGGVPARNANGDRIILFLGIIDILQNYRLLKKFEHTWKSILHDGDTISVHNPKFYAQRFLSFMEESVFKKLAVGRVATGIAVGVAAQGGKFRTLVHSFLALKHSPSRRRAPARRSLGEDEPATPRDVVPSMVRGTVRRSYNRQDTQELLANKPKEKKVERLFGGSTSARTDPSTSALAEEPESEVTRL